MKQEMFDRTMKEMNQKIQDLTDRLENQDSRIKTVEDRKISSESAVKKG